MRYSLLLLLAVTLALFGIRSTAAAQSTSSHGVTTGATAITFTVPLATLDDVRRLDQLSAIAEVIHIARYFSDSPIFLEAYVTADDIRAHHADASGIAVADQLVIEMGGYLASRGVEADRISGRGMGIDSAIGRAVVVSFGVTAAPAGFFTLL
jgi:hypothetical protein